MHRFTNKYTNFTRNRRLGGKKPGNLNGSCVRDPVAGDYFVISAPGARAGRALGVGA